MMDHRTNSLLGVARLARGRPEGLAQFGDTPQAFLISLAPLIAFLMVGFTLAWATMPPSFALMSMLALLIGYLAPPVLSHALAARWGREEDWLRYAVAFNWCQLLAPVAAIGMLLGAQIAVGLGVPAFVAVFFGSLLLFCYLVWVQWLVARHGLDLSRGRAAGLVALVTAGTYVLILLPRLLASVLENGSAG